jgi:membrane protein YdbS with pleckstrin-like domain
MFSAFRGWCERWLRIPDDPEPPPGDEARTQRFRAAPNFYKYLLFIWGLRSFGLIAVLLPSTVLPLVTILLSRHADQIAFTLSAAVPIFVLSLVVLLRLFALALVRLDFDKRWYLVTDRSLRIREGILNVREMTITFANIQNISISQGPLQRAIGIADLRVDTAGGSSPARHHQKGTSQSMHTAWFRGVDNANAIRELIQKRLRELKDSGLGDREEAASMTPRQQASVPGEFLAALREVATEAIALRAVAAK